jgi:hypothetical protein
LKDTWREERLARFAKEHGKEELRLLVLFKQIKTKVEEELKRRGIQIDDDILNQVCVDKAAELLPPDRDITPEELLKLVEDVTARTKEKYAKRSL